MDEEDLARWRGLTGFALEGAFAFGDSAQAADELLAFVARGTKRATVGSVAELESLDEPFPAPGQYWGLLDGADELRFVVQTVEVACGELGRVSPVFAWDEGEGDRTWEDWLDGHRRYFRRQGVTDPDRLVVAFERFRVVWPEPDAVTWLADGVREARWDERGWIEAVYLERFGTTQALHRGVAHDVTELPAVVCERDGERVGLGTFRPRPGVETDLVSVDAFEGGADVEVALAEGVAELGRRNGWQRILPPDPRTEPEMG